MKLSWNTSLILRNVFKGFSLNSTKCLSDFVKIVEVGPRDGLQNELKPVSTSTKIELINRLSACNIQNIEATSFVSPKWVPQMKDHNEVMGGINRHENVIYSALTPNIKGFEAALKAQVNEVAIFGAASEAFSQKNINCSIAESLERFEPVVKAAKDHGVPVRGYVSCVVGCPYIGKVHPLSVINVATSMLEMGCYEISLGDTIGVGTVNSFKNLLDTVILEDIPIGQLAIHCHDTYGQALPNILTSIGYGIRTVDSSVAGLGGCPYAKGASGNVSSEDAIYMLEGIGLTTGINLDRLIETGKFISNKLGRQNLSKVGSAYSQNKGAS